jgi:excinuclease UvrABC ATPase subunit
MYTIDDPMFSLILRFIGHNKKISFCDNGFLHKQLQAIQEHVNKFPQEEQELRAIEWIEKYARQYRKMWEKETMTKQFVGKRCPDCPLDKSKIKVLKCQVHDKWMKIFQQYANNEINSKQYVEKNLKLLSQHKEHLKIKLSELRKQELTTQNSNLLWLPLLNHKPM